MLGEHHDLETDFPEFRERISELKSVDSHFEQLYTEYRSVDHEVYRIEEQFETPSDDYIEQLKLRRLRLKDQLYDILKDGH